MKFDMNFEIVNSLSDNFDSWEEIVFFMWKSNDPYRGLFQGGGGLFCKSIPS